MNSGEIIIFVLLILGSAFFSGTEIALMNIPLHKINALIKKGNKTALLLKHLKNKSDRLLITILIGNNIVNITAASLATKISIDIAEISGREAGTAIGISTGVVTLLILLFWEIFPKSLALKYADTIALKVVRIYKVLQIILFPIVRLVESLIKVLKSKKSHKMTDEEIEAFIDMGNKEGIFEKGEYEKIKNMLDFYEITAEETMVPRVKIEALDANLTLQQALNKVLQFSHSRIPIYEHNIDQINRVTSIRELFQLQQNPIYLDKKLKDLPKNDIIKVPLTTPTHTILDMFKRSRKHIAVINDEYGGVAWLITLEDIVEEVFGDIKDEIDREPIAIRETPTGLLIQWDVKFEDVIQKLGIDFLHLGLSEEEFWWETTSYVFMSKAKGLPKLGQKVTLPIHDIEHEEVKKSLIMKISKIENKVIQELEVSINKKVNKKE
jgi:putative hemolysin